jgi:NADH:ubiquinone oxidoreductase subunit E
MSKIKMTKVPFKGTAEQEGKLRGELKEIAKMAGAMMPALQAATEIYGYLPVEVQKMIAEELNVPIGEVFGVATFYAQFSLNPKGRRQVGVCMGTACYVKGAGDILDRVNRVLNCKTDECTEDGEFSVAATRCVGCCGLAPLFTVNEKVYGKISVDDTERILKGLMSN